jgi:uracil-DNA glycosylase family 4
MVMRWTERQQAMLAEMGIRVWGPEGRSVEDGGTAATAGDRPAAEAAAGAAAPVSVAGAARVAEPRPPAFAAERPQLRTPGEPDSGSGGVPAADALAILDWPALDARVAACRACALCAGRRGVPGAGHRQADWMVVGGAPEAADEAAGTPYAGRRGELLDNMLRPLGLAREAGDPARQPWLTHAVKCRPPDDRTPEGAEVASCASFLLREVALVKPRIVLALGRQAAQALLGRDEPLGRLRGQVHRPAGMAVVVTHEPAFLLRQPQLKAEAWDDLCLALEAAGSTEAG